LFETKSHDLEGEGEEDEETTHAVRVKVFKLSQSNGETSWADMGIGMLRLKKHKEKGTRRALLRNSNTGKITINFNLYAEMKPSVTGKVVAFVGHENGAHMGFRLRLRSEDDAVELKKALEKEIDIVKAKSG
jgi:nucleoporin NUP2